MASSPAGSSGGRDTRTQLFVGNLPYRIRWQDLKDLFRRAGTVLRADVALGPDNRSRGHGTVLLASQEDAERALSMFQGWCWQGRVLEVRKDRVITGEEGLSIGSSLPSPMAGAGFAPGLGNGVPSPAPMSRLNSGMGLGLRTDIGLRQLPFHIQWQDLKDLFRQAGAVTRADVALGADGRSRGFGTVSFSNEQDAERAVRMFNG
ncbi:hypothetical protein C8Q72DRAFT_779742 [Fomitopsis betulina]|nr:hypothetical protein C8Q72DRAFT_779742 [Fomitopsis betulina]